MADAQDVPFLQRAVANAVEATMGRMEAGVAATAKGVIDDLEPYLADETVPRILDAVVPQLVDSLIPEILDGVTDHIVKVTAPQIIEGLTPALADDLIPILVERMRPQLETELVPAIVDALTPHLVTVTAPALIDGLMPKIRGEVVPAIIDDIADDPAMRDLIREQSLGLVLDSFEGVRRALSTGDDVFETAVRSLLRMGPLTLTEDAPPPARTRQYAGVVTRGAAALLDLALVAFITTQGLAATLNVLRAVSDPLPAWLVAGLTFLFALTAPVYLTLCWRFSGRTLGGGLTGFAVTGTDGRNLRLGRALVRAVLSLVALPVWVLGSIASARDAQRRNWLDKIVRSRTPYRVHVAQRTERRRTPASAP
jgi:hypothetical protein